MALIAKSPGIFSQAIHIFSSIEKNVNRLRKNNSDQKS